MPTVNAGRRGLVLLLSLAVAVPGCVFQHVEVQPLPLDEGTWVRSPVKAHLKDGSTVVFEKGVVIGNGMLGGRGTLHDLTLAQATPVDSIPLDRVAAVESFRTATSAAESAAGIVTSLAATAGIALGTAVLLVGIFGSCPTVYSSGGDGPVLEAETFSHSIAALLESRDLDRLRAGADVSGRVTLEVRNEALETHYINHLQLLEVVHPRGALVAPDADNRPLVVGDPRPFASAVDRAGREVGPVLADADGVALEADPDSLAAAETGDLEDWIDLAAPADGRREAALELRLKNSLLSTVLFYDVMLASAGPRALAWIGSDLDQISTAVRLGRWVHRRLGMRVSVWEDGRYREVARLPDAGPIAWRDVAVAVPVPPAESTLRVRLSFTPDLWRIDKVALARAGGGRVSSRAVAASMVIGRDGRPDPEALASIRRPDGRYLQTTPGERFKVVFDAGPAPAGAERTFLLSSQGYYTEWIRAEWLRAGTAGAPFTPSDAALRTALRRWREVRTSMEGDFERHRIPVL
ncbi:MAG TPA: hypothetical protein VGN09_07110 [Vicinamibacteria bacterium]